MEVIDDEGNLFGVINIIDAIVVLGVLAIVVAGIALINPFAGGEQATRYATIDLGEQPEFVAEQIDEGDEMPLESAPGNLTITDVYVSPGAQQNASVVVRARLNGQLVFDETREVDVFQFAGDRVTRGRTLQIETLEYDVDGTVTAVGDSGSGLDTATRQVLIQTEVSAETAQTIQLGDSYRIGGREVGTVESVTVFPGSNPTRRLLVLGLDLSTVNRGDGPRFAGQRVLLGATVGFRSEDYALSGQVIEVGTAEPTIGQTQVVIQATVPTTTANSIAVGDEYQVDSTRAGTVESIQTYPTGNRNTERVALGLSLRTIDRQGTPQFGTQELRLGSSVRFRTDAYDLSGEVIRRGDRSLPGESRERTVTVKLANVRPELANSVAVGMTESRSGVEVARITDKRVNPAEIVLTSESGDIFRREHPRNKDVYLTVRIQVRQTDSGALFHAQPLQSNTDVVLDLGSVTIQGTVIEVEGG